MITLAWPFTRLSCHGSCISNSRRRQSGAGSLSPRTAQRHPGALAAPTACTDSRVSGAGRATSVHSQVVCRFRPQLPFEKDEGGHNCAFMNAASVSSSELAEQRCWVPCSLPCDPFTGNGSSHEYQSGGRV